MEFEHSKQFFSLLTISYRSEHLYCSCPTGTTKHKGNKSKTNRLLWRELAETSKQCRNQLYNLRMFTCSQVVQEQPLGEHFTQRLKFLSENHLMRVTTLNSLQLIKSLLISESNNDRGNRGRWRSNNRRRSEETSIILSNSFFHDGVSCGLLL